MPKMDQEMQNALRAYLDNRNLTLEEWRELYTECDNHEEETLRSFYALANLMEDEAIYIDGNDQSRKKGVPLSLVFDLAHILKSRLDHLRLYRNSREHIGQIIDRMEKRR